ncbi:efflux RND transporter periplasmic adaptor subunit [Gracilibacillus caseinilyticus]|uniref:Efflux RND transporter periplasmic adaptor subunit n=1 Tax=Gracilibacillus caseinilyticus TaxID=2932256 RepID=A0ABY4F0S2_9BACI|nr:efflux RND transporter periplasmic adaptor subunit [Gracilibacillus caseinilyticus]UOQ50273.1 efflux RND transporter periplasmic adaptor subunit [Gracilibacillus caseinilyticus]
MKRLLFLLMIVIITLVACSQNENEEQEEETERVIPVETGEVTKGDLVMDRVFYGRTSPNQSTPVIPSVAGEMDELEVANGDKVEEGDDIATIASPQGMITVEAPSDGVITQLTAKEGSMVSTQDPLAVVTDLASLNVQLQVADTQLDLFEEGKEVSVTTGKDDGEAHQATIDYVADVSNDSGLFHVDLSFDNESTNVKAGVVAKAIIKDTVVQDSLQIPTAALVEQDQETFVYVVDGDTARKVAVTVQATQSQSTAVKAELSEGDQLVTSGQLTLVDGSKIKVEED